MSWKDRLLSGSFRGIPFYIDEHSLAGGRAAVQHEPADRDSTFSEDTGIKGRVYTVECHVLGDAYFFTRDALISAMEDRDNGILIHPYLGAKDVRPVSFEVRESTQEGRIASFTLQFVDTGEVRFPLAVIDAVTSFLTSAFSTVAQVKNAFQLAYDISGLPGYVAESAASVIADFVATIDAGVEKFALDPANRSAFSRALDDILGNSASLVNNPASLAAELDNVIGLLRTLPADPPDSFTIDTQSGSDDKLEIFSLVTSYDSGSSSLPENTPTRQQQKKSLLALDQLIRQLGVINLSQNSAEKEYLSTTGAVEQRDKVAELFDRESRVDGLDDDTYQA